MSGTREVPPAEVPDEVAPEPAGNGLRGVLRRRLRRHLVRDLGRRHTGLAHPQATSSFPRAPVMAAMTCSMVVSAAW